MKTATNRLNPIEKIATAILVGLFIVASANSQNFNLQTAKASDKIAQSMFFAIDSNKVLNAYAMHAFNSPAIRIRDSVFVVDRVNAAVSTTKGLSNNPVRKFSLEQNFPNPFNPSTTIRFSIGKRAKVSVVLYDVTGKEVGTLVGDTKEAGSYDVQWNGINDNGSNVASGTYLYRLLATSDDGSTTVETRKMTLVK